MRSDRADRGAVLSMRELLDIAAIWHTARTLRDYYTADREYETSIGVYFSRLEENRSAESRITRAILSEDMMADEASPALADIRRKTRSASGRMKGDAAAVYQRRVQQVSAGEYRDTARRALCRPRKERGGTRTR